MTRTPPGFAGSPLDASLLSDEYATRSVAGGITDWGYTGSVFGLAAQLDDREREVLRLIAAALDTAEIARTISYSQRAVKYTIQKVLTRLKLRDRSHAVAYALRNGLL